jgi:prolyl-tRNA editing enzyme YbaK/EbsC (Cys-tRNA(Pro) deacylase)
VEILSSAAGGRWPVPDSLPAASRRVIAAGETLGVAVDVHEFPEGTKTSADAAAAIGCELAQIVKSLVFVVDDDPVIALLPGDLRLDPARLAAAAGGSTARRATLEEAREATGFAAGGTPPFGHASSLTILADRNLRRHDAVWAAAGTPTTVFPISLGELIDASGARWADLAQRPAE